MCLVLALALRLDAGSFGGHDGKREAGCARRGEDMEAMGVVNVDSKSTQHLLIVGEQM